MTRVFVGRGLRQGVRVQSLQARRASSSRLQRKGLLRNSTEQELLRGQLCPCLSLAG